MKISTTKTRKAGHLKHASQFNVGRAFFEGFGVKQSDTEAEK